MNWQRKEIFQVLRLKNQSLVDVLILHTTAARQYKIVSTCNFSTEFVKESNEFKKNYQYMKRILAFGASSSNASINKKLAKFASEQVQNVEVTFLDLNDYKMPLYDIDDEKANGIPELAVEIKKYITEIDGILISFAEHNGSYSTVFKNILDWISRIKGDTFLSKPMFLLATSPGARGGKGVLSHASSRFPFMGGNVVATYSLPSFNVNFTVESGITDETLLMEFEEQLKVFQATIDGKI